MDIETMEEDALKLAMQKKGLIFMWFISEYVSVVCLFTSL
jgi:hypothetical protein